MKRISYTMATILSMICFFSLLKRQTSQPDRITSTVHLRYIFYYKICIFAEIGIQTAYFKPRVHHPLRHIIQLLMTLRGMLFFCIKPETQIYFIVYKVQNSRNLKVLLELYEILYCRSHVKGISSNDLVILNDLK